MYDHTFYKQVQISRSDIRPHIKWAVSLVILHMVTSIFLWALCGYTWVNILTLSPRGEDVTSRETESNRRPRGGEKSECAGKEVICMEYLVAFISGFLHMCTKFTCFAANTRIARNAYTLEVAKVVQACGIVVTGVALAFINFCNKIQQFN